MYESGGQQPTRVGPYELLAPLWRGKTADFFVATATRDPGARRVVVKRLRPDLLEDPDFFATFLHQANIAIDLRHPNIVECYETFEHAGALIMEFIHGQSLARIRQRRNVVTAVPTSIHLRVLVDLLDALHYLHETRGLRVPDGIIHGDVRPDNVFVTFDGRTKLLHAGIENAEATTGIIREKLSYMSPERAKGDHVDRRSDLFSVGVMLWEAATGLRFWRELPDVAIFQRLCAEEGPLQSGWVPIAAREVFDIAVRAIAVNPDERFQTATEMKLALEEVLAGSAGESSADAIRAYMANAFSPGRPHLAQQLSSADDDEAPTTLRVAPESTTVRVAPESIPPISRNASSPANEVVPRPTKPSWTKLSWTPFPFIGLTAVILIGLLLGRALAIRPSASAPSCATCPGSPAPAPPPAPLASAISAALPAWTVIPAPSALPVAPARTGDAGTPGGRSPGNRNDVRAKPIRPNGAGRAEDLWGI